MAGSAYYLGKQGQRAVESSTYHQNYAIDRVEQNCAESLSRRGLTKCIVDEINSAHDHNRSNSDVEYQRSMAWGAWAMVGISVITMILTILGLLAIIRTLFYTGKAATFAVQTLREARRTTNAAKNAVVEARSIGRAELRAYLNVKSVEVMTANSSVRIENFNGYHMHSEGYGIKLRINIENVGQTPAQNVMVKCHPSITSYFSNKDQQSRDWFDFEEPLFRPTHLLTPTETLALGDIHEIFIPVTEPSHTEGYMDLDQSHAISIRVTLFFGDIYKIGQEIEASFFAELKSHNEDSGWIKLRKTWANQISGLDPESEE